MMDADAHLCIFAESRLAAVTDARLFHMHFPYRWDDSVIADNSVDVVYDCVGQRDTADRAMRTSLSTRLPCANHP